jgi:hypothetical protein
MWNLAHKNEWHECKTDTVWGTRERKKVKGGELNMAKVLYKVV